MNRTGKVLGTAVLSAVLLAGCNESNGVGSDAPEFSNAVVSGENKTYVAYKSPDPEKKPDTVTLSFDYNSSKAKSISIQATVDSGKTWLSVTTVTPNGSNRHTIYWTPKSSSNVPRYFGMKRCFFRITDTTTGVSVDSDTFPLVGAAPLTLLTPLDNATYHLTDTIKVQYGMNKDLSSNIQTYFKTDAMEKWVEFVNDSRLPSPDAPLIQNLQKYFVPAAVDSAIRIEAENFSHPIKIYLKDYSASDPNCFILTNYITILQ